MEENDKKQQNRISWFWSWILDNKVVTGLLILLLVLLNLLLLNRVSPVFKPIKQFFDVIGLPIIMSGILYYLLNPLVDMLEKRKVPRTVSIVGIFIIVIGLIIWGIAALVPIIRDQTMSFIDNFPSYWDQIINQADELLKSDYFAELKNQINNFNKEWLSGFSDKLTGTIGSTVNSIGNVVGAVSNVVLALVTMPFILFYLLKDGKQFPQYLLKAVPVKYRDRTYTMMSEMNTQVSQYIRGQLIVAFFVAIMFIIGYSIIGLQYAVTLGILAGLLNVIPYLGSFLAMVPSVILALVISPTMLIKVLIVFVIEQTIEGRVISPQVLGSNLEIHPVTIIVVLLTSGKLFGVAGVILGIPGYAVLKVLVTHLFEWYKATSKLYEEDYVEKKQDPDPPKPEQTVEAK